MPLGLTRIGLSTAPRSDYFWAASASGATVSLGTATESDSAHPLTADAPKNVSVGTATESDSASSLCIEDSRINFNDYTVNGHGGSQDSAGSTWAVSDCGHTLSLWGNNWKDIVFNYTITANTVIELDFKSSTQSEIHAIGFATGESINSAKTFQFWGTQTWGITTYMNYGSSSPDYKHYTIPVGSHYTGSHVRLFFANDDDASPIGNSTFSNIKIYEAATDQTIGIGSPSESDSASSLVVVNPRSYQLGSAAEVDAAQSASFGLSVGLGTASEVDAAHPLTASVAFPKYVSLGSAAEVDSASSLTVQQGKTVSVGTASESDSGESLSLVNPRTHVLAAATEADSAESLAVVNPREYGTGTATEVDSASSAIVLNPKSYQLGAVAEVDSAAAVTVNLASLVSLGSPQEIDSAHSLLVDNPRTCELGSATEVDTAEAVVVENPRLYILGLADEQDTAGAFASVLNPKSVDLGSASESDAPASVDFYKFVEVGLATEVDAANALSVQRSLGMGLATEVDAALPLFVLTVDTTADCVHVDSSWVKSGSSAGSIESGCSTATLESPSASVLFNC